MGLKLINGLFYFEHTFDDINNQALIDEIKYTKENPDRTDLDDSRPHPLDLNEEGMDMQHTFYEDVPLTNKSLVLLGDKVQGVCDSIFNMKQSVMCEEGWGHVIPPGEQTMVHNHGSNTPVGGSKNELGLSWVYYPHMPVKSGNLIFIASANQQRVMWEIESTPSTLYLFSRDILHFTPRNASKETRISVSGNCVLGSELMNVIRKDIGFKNNFWYFQGREGENIVDRDKDNGQKEK